MNFKNKGFTLIELLVVIAIIGILAGFIAIRMSAAVNAANDAKRRTTIDTIKTALIWIRLRAEPIQLKAWVAKWEVIALLLIQ